MPILSATGLSLVDIAMLSVILIGLPLEVLLTLKKDRAELASGAPGVRVKHYTQTLFMLWGVSLPILVIWAANGRNWADLGFTMQSGWLPMAGWALAGLIAVFFFLQFSTIIRSPSARAQYQAGLAKNPIMVSFLPHTEDEKQLFNLLGVTAGITKEIFFRGFPIGKAHVCTPLPQ